MKIATKLGIFIHSVEQLFISRAIELPGAVFVSWWVAVSKMPYKINYLCDLSWVVKGRHDGK